MPAIDRVDPGISFGSFLWVAGIQGFRDSGQAPAAFQVCRMRMLNWKWRSWDLNQTL